MKQLFKTTYTNDRHAVVNVYERDGSLLFALDPGESVDVESISADTMYSRWSQVVWRRDGTVGFLARTNWTEPDRGRWTIRLLNAEGAELEFRQIGGVTKQVEDDDPLRSISTGSVIRHPMKNVIEGGERICLPRHIPVLVGLTLTDPLVAFQSLTIKRVEIRMKDTQQEGYLTRERVLQDVTEPRSDSELKVLGKLLDELGK